MNLGLWHCRQIILPSEPPGKPLVSFPCGLSGKKKKFSCNVGDLGSFSGLGRSPGEGKGYPLQSSGLENSMDCIVHGVTKSWTQLSDFHVPQTGSIVLKVLVISQKSQSSWGQSLDLNQFTAIFIILSCLETLCRKEWRQETLDLLSA